MEDRLQSDRCSQVLKALADADRLKILQCLEQKACDVSELTNLTGGKLANVSHHLQVLRRAEIVLSKRNGRHIIYSLNPAVFRPDGNGGTLDLDCCRLQLPGHNAG